jgi:formate dehydrogenase subunit gamma
MNLFRVLTIIGILGTVAAVAAHYLFFGPHHGELKGEPRTVKRLSLWERVAHIATVAVFLALAITGFYSVLMGWPRLEGWLLWIHWTVAPLFALGLVSIAFTWCETCRFEAHDLEWARCFGGYLGGDAEAPAGRFNGGQKMFFWFILALGIAVVLSGVGRMSPVFGDTGQRIVLEVHRYAALGLVLSMLVHLYLGTLANPGTVGVMLSGRVSRQWAAAHHSVWWRRLNNLQGGETEHE